MIHDNIIIRSGDMFMPYKIKKILNITLLGNSKTYYINGWSFMHLVSGMIIGYIYIYLGYSSVDYYYKMFILHTIWELWQMLIGIVNPFKWKGDSGLADTIVDTIFFMIGSYMIHKWCNYKNKFFE